ncbi:MAG TPA: GNAT family N-acetyltransferase [Solirubrobacteraceae bacterium]
MSEQAQVPRAGLGEQPAVRRVRAQDVPALAEMLARAFYDDPVTQWAWRPDELRLRALERFQATRMRQLLGGEEVWASEDLQCAALWAPPEHWHATLRETAELVPAFRHPRLLARMPLVALGWEKLERSHPRKPPHYYLAVLGTEPSAQGRGLGSRVLRAVLDQCDRDAVGAYLESSKESNIAFYARHGFRVTEEFRLLRGPLMWKMWRDPLGG